MKTISILCLVLALLPASPVISQERFDPGEFEHGVSRIARAYDNLARQDEVQHLLLSGDLDAYHQRLIQHTPAEEKTFYDNFVLANILFREHPELSRDFMLKAEAQEPQNPYVWYERAIHEHRQGHCAKAITYYRQLHAHHPDLARPASWAYRTHCALRLGAYKEAIEAWQHANFGRNHTAIEKAMYVIFSNNRPHTARQQIIKRIDRGEHAAFCDLFEHDRNWETDWWNVAVRQPHVTYDLALAEETIAAGSTQAEIINLCAKAPQLSDQQFETALTEAGLWGERATLPVSGALVYAIALRLTASGRADAQDLVDRFGDQMWRRLESGTVDRKLLEVMGFLYSSIGDAEKLHAVDAYGWREMHLNRSAASYLLGTDPESTEFPALLDEAVADFPNDALINRQKLAAGRNGNTDNNKALTAHYIAAEFANVMENWKGPYRLSDFMASFAYELNQQSG